MKYFEYFPLFEISRYMRTCIFLAHLHTNNYKETLYILLGLSFWHFFVNPELFFFFFDNHI
jgi:hypothetical protein